MGKIIILDNFYPEIQDYLINGRDAFLRKVVVSEDDDFELPTEYHSKILSVFRY